MTDGLKTLPAQKLQHWLFCGQFMSCEVSFSLLRRCSILAIEYGLLLVLILVKVNSKEALSEVCSC